MRTVNEFTEDVRARCLTGHAGDIRAERAIDFARDWFRVHPPRDGDDRYMVSAHCCRAVECRGRNDQVAGLHWEEWDAIVRDVVGRLTDWFFERVLHEVVPG